MAHQKSMAPENEQLLQDVRQVLSHTEDLLHTVGEEGGEKFRELRQRIGTNLTQAKTKLIEAEKALAGKARAAAKVTDQYVHDHPWKSMGVAAGVGLLLGMLISRR